ncbi:MAG: STAS domain-containing protein [Thermoflexales bacterium]|nr:STAS domain-containing protein [Thermoflexales bacterium]
MSTKLNISVSHQKRPAAVTVFHLKGEVDASSYQQLESEARQAYEAGTRDLIIDLRQVTYLGSAGLRALHAIFNLLRTNAPEESDEAMKKGLREGTFKSPHLKLIGPSSTILETIKTTGLDMYLEIYPQLQEALASFPPHQPAAEDTGDIAVHQGRVPVAVLRPTGYLDASNYRELIAQAQQVYDTGGRDILLDLSQVTFVSSSGLVALHAIAKLLGSGTGTDLDSGWEALHALSRETSPGRQQHIKLLAPQAAVGELLETVGFTEFFEIHTDEAEAIASF